MPDRTVRFKERHDDTHDCEPRLTARPQEEHWLLCRKVARRVAGAKGAVEILAESAELLVALCRSQARTHRVPHIGARNLTWRH